MLRTMSLVIAILCAGLTAAQTQTYPDRPVRVSVGFAAGSGPDIQARTVSLALGNSLGQQFYVENRLGANGTIAARAVAQSKPDGYSLLFSSSSIISTPYIYKSLGYDTMTDLRPIATVGQLDGIFMLVDAKSPIKTRGGLPRPGQEGSRRLRLAGRRQRPAPDDRDLRQEGGDQVAAHPLPGRVRSHDRAARRQRADDVRHAALLHRP